MFDYVLPLDGIRCSSNSRALRQSHCRRKVFGQTRWNRCAECAVTRVSDSQRRKWCNSHGSVGFGPTDPRWIHTGLGAGAARPSTGYAFKRIQRLGGDLRRGILKEGLSRAFRQTARLLTWMIRCSSEQLRAIRPCASAFYVAGEQGAPIACCVFLRTGPVCRIYWLLCWLYLSCRSFDVRLLKPMLG